MLSAMLVFYLALPARQLWKSRKNNAPSTEPRSKKYRRSLAGIAGAVILSSLAYGLAHGYQGPKQLAASIASAFVFTIGFALTQSL